MSLNTGDNAPKRPGTLRKAVALCVKYGHHVIKNIEDKKGRYSVLMASQDNQRYYLIAKASRIMRMGASQVISTQKALLLIAKQENRPIVMCYWAKPEKPPVWKVFNPEECLSMSFGENRRDGVVFTNFEWMLGRPVYTPDGIAEKWRKWK